MPTTSLVVLAALAVLVAVLAGRLGKRPRTPWDYLRAGDRALRTGDLDRAAALYREALQLDYRYTGIHYKLASVAWLRGDFDAVIEHLRDCQRWHPDVSDIEYRLGAAYYRKGDHEAAVKHFERAVELDPKAHESREALAALYHELGRTCEAKAVCPEFTPPGPEDERARRAWEQLGPRARAGLARWDKAAYVLMCIQAVSTVVFGACLLLFVATLAYGFVVRPAHLWLLQGSAFAIVLKGSVAGIFLPIIGRRALEAAQNRQLRRTMTRSGVAREDAEAVLPVSTEPASWKVELSGFHLVLWLGLPLLVIGWRAIGRGDEWPGWVYAVVFFLGFGWFCKAMIIFNLLTGSSGPGGAWVREYRWFGTMRGTLVALAAVAGLELFGWLAFALALR